MARRRYFPTGVLCPTATIVALAAHVAAVHHQRDVSWAELDDGVLTAATTVAQASGFKCPAGTERCPKHPDSSVDSPTTCCGGGSSCVVKGPAVVCMEGVYAWGSLCQHHEYGDMLCRSPFMACPGEAISGWPGQADLVCPKGACCPWRLSGERRILTATFAPRAVRLGETNMYYCMGADGGPIDCPWRDSSHREGKHPKADGFEQNRVSKSFPPRAPDLSVELPQWNSPPKDADKSASWPTTQSQVAQPVTPPTSASDPFEAFRAWSSCLSGAEVRGIYGTTDMKTIEPEHPCPEGSETCTNVNFYGHKACCYRPGKCTPGEDEIEYYLRCIAEDGKVYKSSVPFTGKSHTVGCYDDIGISVPCGPEPIG